ncbi:uncharacterized protein [Rutidosis leptorrhynchoides]|uniref:uncharacterized protein n=1 Tax=Rutidosis leptorrhynchoides TaxID=125765 RepID=UPI003A9A0CCB
MKTQHNCTRSFINALALRKWLTEKLLPEIMKKPTMSTRDILSEVRKTWRLEISLDKGYAVRRMAFDKIHGTYKEQYARIIDYAAKIARRNPGATSLVTHAGGRFERMYVSFPACTNNFRYCRPLICVDRAHLKGHNTNQILTAVGRDANGQFFPIAIAMVEKECQKIWLWFLGLVLEDLGGRQASISAIMKKQHDPADYVDDCYKPSTFLKHYSGEVHGTNSPNQWPVTGLAPLLPPPL